MIGESIKHVAAGDRVSASEHNKIVDAVTFLSKLRVVPPLNITQEWSGPVISLSGADGMWVRITGNAVPGINGYSWVSQIAQGSGALVDDVQGQTDCGGAYLAYEVGGNVNVPVDAIVKLEPGYQDTENWHFTYASAVETIYARISGWFGPLGNPVSPYTFPQPTNGLAWVQEAPIGTEAAVPLSSHSTGVPAFPEVDVILPSPSRPDLDPLTGFYGFWQTIPIGALVKLEYDGTCYRFAWDLGTVWVLPVATAEGPPNYLTPPQPPSITIGPTTYPQGLVVPAVVVGLNEWGVTGGNLTGAAQLCWLWYLNTSQLPFTRPLNIGQLLGTLVEARYAGLQQTTDGAGHACYIPLYAANYISPPPNPLYTVLDLAGTQTLTIAPSVSVGTDTFGSLTLNWQLGTDTGPFFAPAAPSEISLPAGTYEIGASINFGSGPEAAWPLILTMTVVDAAGGSVMVGDTFTFFGSGGNPHAALFENGGIYLNCSRELVVPSGGKTYMVNIFGVVGYYSGPATTIIVEDGSFWVHRIQA